jgi:hypothetical protein
VATGLAGAPVYGGLITRPHRTHTARAVQLIEPTPRKADLLKRTILGALGALGLAVATTTLTPAPAQAATSCGSIVQVHSSAYNGGARYCPMWRGNVPVFGKNSAGLVDPGKVVGYLVSGGWSNWFICHWTAGSTYSAYGYTSRDYAATVADNGKGGWASAVFFSGVQNYWAGLDECPLGYYGWP